jgi:hypothetical protein
MPTEPVKGLRELSRKLSQLDAKSGGKILRSAAMRSTLPAFKAIKAAAPKSDRSFPHKTHKGRWVAPGFLSRSVARKSRLSRDKRTATVLLGVKPEAFYGLQFVELGTSKQRRQPWLEPNFRRSRHAVVARFGDIMRQKILQVARR